MSPRIQNLRKLVALTKQPACLRKDPDTGAFVLEIEDTTYVDTDIDPYIESALKTARRKK
jgi:hypothetical protein